MSTPIYVRNLPAATTEVELRRLFWGFGRVSAVSITRVDASRAEGTVELSGERAAATVALVLQGAHMGRRTLDVSLKRPEVGEVSWDGRSGGLNSQAREPD